MECDVAVLGGGPAGYTAAIRAAQLGGSVVCVEREPALGGTCLRVGCIPTKAWVQSAHAFHEARETFAKLGVITADPQLDFGTVASWKDGVVDQMTGGVAVLFKAFGVEWLNGNGTFTGPNTLAVEGHEDVTFRSAIVATGAFPMRPPIPGLDSPRCVDSTGLLAQTSLPRRLVVLGGGIIGCEFASLFAHFGTEVAIIEMLPTLIPQEDEDATKELHKAFRRRGIAMHLEKQCTGVEDHGDRLVVHFGDGESLETDLMLVSVGRAPLVEGIGLEAAGVTYDRRAGIATDDHRRTSVPTSTRQVTWPATGSSHTPGSARVRSRRRTRWVTRRGWASRRCRARSTPIPRSPRRAHRGAGPRAPRRCVQVGRFPWVANARAVMSGETAGWVKSIHESTYGELLGLVIVGPRATDLIETGVVALDAEATVETVADGIAAHPTLSEAIKEAGLVALGRRSTCHQNAASVVRKPFELAYLSDQQRTDTGRCGEAAATQSVVSVPMASAIGPATR